MIRDVTTNLLLLLSSHHFLLQVVLEVQVVKNKIDMQPVRKYDVSVLKDPVVATTFADAFNEHMLCSVQSSVNMCPSDGVNLLYDKILDGFDHAATRILPTQIMKPKKPWISATTIQLLERRKAARLAMDYDEEQRLVRSI